MSEVLISRSVRGPFHGLAGNNTDLAHTFQIGTGSISMEVGTSERKYKRRQPSPTNLRCRPSVLALAGRTGPCTRAAFADELPDVRDLNPASAVVTLIYIKLDVFKIKCD